MATVAAGSQHQSPIALAEAPHSTPTLKPSDYILEAVSAIQARQKTQSQNSKPAGSSSEPFTTKKQKQKKRDRQPSASIAEEEAIALQLEGLVAQFVEAINSRTYETHPSTGFLSPSFRAEAEYRPTTTTREQHFECLRQFLKAFPTYSKELVHCEANVNLAARYADVYAHIVVKGAPVGLERHTIAVFEFRLQGKQEKWICVKYTGYV